MQDKIELMIKKANEDIKMYRDDIDDHYNRYGDGDCDYLTHRLQMLTYHKGELNALTKLTKQVYYVKGYHMGVGLLN